jgi:beta propeller repeat protein
VVWVDNRDDISHYILYTEDPVSHVQGPVSPGPGGQWVPEVDGDRVVWQDQRNDDGDIYLYDFGTATETPICVATGVQATPDIDGDIVVWRDDRSGTPTIWFYDLLTSATGPVSPQVVAQYAPRISGTRVVWHASGGVYLNDLASPGLRGLSQGPGWYPDIDGDIVVWQCACDGDWDIYLYVNLPPELAPIGDQVVAEGDTLTFTVSANDPDDDPLIFSASILPAGAAFDPETRQFSWTPILGQAGTYSGVHFEVSDGELSDSEDITITVTGPARVEVGIDIRPGSSRNPVNPRSHGMLPVAVFSSAGFDATDIDPSTVDLAGATVAQNPNDGGWMIEERDENRDGLMDVRLQFNTEEIDVEQLAGDYAILTGSTFGGVDFEGRDIVTIVPPDIPNDHWAIEAIAECLRGDVVTGYADGLYHPEIVVTRDQMAVFVSRACAGGDSSVPDFTATPTFPDVSDTFWALKYVEFAVDEGVVTGYDDGKYHPEYQVNRGQMAVYIARALVAPSGEAGLADYVPSDPRNFPDVPSDFWSYTQIEYCVENGVVNGYDDGLYHPEIVVTRDQMAVYIALAWELPM